MKYQKFGLTETLPKSNFDFASTLTLRESLIWVIPQNNNYMMIAMCSSDFRLQKNNKQMTKRFQDLNLDDFTYFEKRLNLKSP